MCDWSKSLFTALFDDAISRHQNDNFKIKTIALRVIEIEKFKKKWLIWLLKILLSLKIMKEIKSLKSQSGTYTLHSD